MSSKAAADVVEAAGGVVWRRRKNVVEVLVVHRPKYDDWSFPKGKQDPGEAPEACALREVEEETGLRCTLGPELEPTSYVDRHGRLKSVRYWMMQATSGAFAPNHEVDEISWLTEKQAAKRLTYARDTDVVRSFTDARRPAD